MKNQSELIRLNKFIAQSGICSRRKADELITSGLIQVNGKTITELGFKVSPNDKVLYQGEILTPKTTFEYLLFNKPKNCICTLKDEKDRTTILPYIQPYTKTRLNPVGRLDRNTTGLLLLTNDGDLHNALLHPSKEIDKIYKAAFPNKIGPSVLESMIAGAELEDGFFAPEEIVLLEDHHQLGIRIQSGRNRILRRYIAHFGLDLISLDRVSFAGLTKYKVPRGKCRMLSENEVRMLKKVVKRNKSSH